MLLGERAEHVGTSGEGGMGIRISDGAQHVTINGVTAKAMWGDGFYVEGARDVKFCTVTAENNRRQKLSIIEADGMTVTDSVFKNTNGTRPSASIDLEPDRPAQEITNVQIQNSKFLPGQSPQPRRECAGHPGIGDLRQPAGHNSIGAVRRGPTPSPTPSTCRPSRRLSGWPGHALRGEPGDPQAIQMIRLRPPTQSGGRP
jgi:hypothetical protein